ncbi:GGDEF domain-containing protein [Companilactobacillus pabuli]|uniref:GGDEF domain-containing protein n=1 Tax=Companilactobacillus pabuli TaxID=2714036 RepID=A0A7L7KW24_9LACO|nr:GGDEF domain-containing protein [Companilactobacillus pabuli]AKP04048.1 diguanylate cyclase [Companilactobacillus farciminis]AKS52353.1 diguanylate cyclase [Companilactobacillus farciminis]QMT83885.1 GGDEF domain-containing protein [Companilactobacillus pabuli]
MTWLVWRVSPFITSIFFILGVFTLFEVLVDWIKVKLHSKDINIKDHTVESVVGIIYMLIFSFGLQYSVLGQSYSWEFMNFQLIAIVFCAYFLNIRIPYYFLLPIVLLFMIYNSSVGYWESWCHAITLIIFYVTMNKGYLWSQKLKSPLFFYLGTGTFFGALLWYFMKLKFDFSWTTYVQELSYLVIFELLLYSYVRMLFRDDRLKARLAEVASHDALTKALNYSAYETEIKYLFKNSKDNNLSFSMVMFDIDHFKRVNDTYGHLAGDRVLQHTVDVVQTVLNANDSSVKLYRTGGEEFNVLFPNYDLEGTQAIVEEIFTALNHLKVETDKKEIEISVSMGVSQISNKDVTPNDFYKRVDNNLYYSKKHGRMQITTI